VLETLVGSLELALGQAEQAQRHEEEVRAQAAFVRFMEATGSIQDLGTLIREVLQTLQALLPGSGAAFYDRAPDGWTLRQQIGTVSAPLTVPLLPDSLPIARLLTERSPLFVEGRDHPSGRPLALYPLQQHHEVTAVLSVSGPDRRPWTDRERTLVSAIGRSFSLLHDRIALAERLQDRQQEAERRMEALEAFAQLTNELGIQGDRYALVQRAQAVVLSLLDDGFAVYYEPDGPVWRLRSQVGSMRNPALQAAVDAGLDFERTENLLRPWRTGEALYQDAYDTGTDALDETKHTVGATATVPLRLDGHCIGVFGIVQFGPRRWTATDRTVLEGVLRSLSLALERAQSISQLAERSRELEHSNAGLRAANEELEAFAYSVSHDLRTPVRHILGFNSLLRRSLQHSDLDSNAVRYLDVVDQSAGRMNTLMPGIERNFLRKSSTTPFIGLRSDWGLSTMNMRPVFCEPVPPLNELTAYTFVSCRIIRAARSCSLTMASKDTSSAASVVTWIWPMSSSGKKPLGITMTIHTVAANVAAATSNTHLEWPKAASSVRV